MVEDKLIRYVQAQLRAGFSEEVIKDALIDAGYSESDVLDAFSDATRPDVAKAPREPTRRIPSPPTPSEEKPQQVAGLDALIEMLKKNWILIIAIVIVATGGLLGFGFFSGGGIGGGKECGAEVDCLADAFRACSRATGIYTTSSRESSLTFAGDLSGKSGEFCSFSVKVEGATGTLRPYKGRSMSCLVPLDFVGIVVNPLRDLSSIKPYCSGTLTTLLD